MHYVIGIHIPEFGSFPPDNYLAANAKIFEHYSQDAFYSSQDRMLYIVTTDALEKVETKISFESKSGVKDYEFLSVSNWQTSAPKDAHEWVSNKLSAIDQLKEFLRDFGKSVSQ